MAQDQDITASVDSRVDSQPIYGGASFSAPVDAGAGFVDPRAALPYAPLADTNVGGISASEYEMRQALARMDADAQARAVAEARAAETAQALRIAAEDPALRAAFPEYANRAFGSDSISPTEQRVSLGRFAAEELDARNGMVGSGYAPWRGTLAPGSGGGRFDRLEIGDAPVEMTDLPLPGADPIDPEAEAVTATRRPGRGGAATREAGGGHGGGGMSEWSWGIGFGAMATGQGISQGILAGGAGNYVDPGVAQAQEFGPLLQGVGSVAGTALGMMIPGIGGMGGQFIGQAAGQVGQSIWEASAGRNAAVRESGETYGGDMGAAASAVKQFTSALEEAHAPVRQLTETLNTMMGAGPGVGAGSVGGADLMAGALGSRFGSVTGGMESSLSGNPFLAGTLTRFNAAGSRLSSGEFGGLAELSALSGDWSGATRAMSEMQAAETDPRHARDMADSRASETLGGWWHDITHPGEVHARVGRLVADHRAGRGGLLPGAEAERQRVEASVARDYELSRGTQAGMLTAQSGMGLSAQSLSLGELSGAADVSGLAGGLYASAEGGLSVLGRQEGAIDSYLGRGDLSADERQAAQYQRAQVEQERGGLRLAEAQTRRALFDRGLQTEESGYGLGEARALYGGQSAADMAHARAGQAAFLSGTALDPRNPLSPSERRQIEGQALSLRFRSAQEQYGQAEAGIGLEQAGASAGLSVARATGGPGDVYGAQSEQARALLDLQRQLNDELEKGNLTYDQRVEKTRQVREITGEVASLESQARNQFFDSTASILSDSRGADAAGLGRSLAVSGSAGADFGAVMGDDSRALSNARAAMANARTPAERERWRRTLAGMTEQQAGDQTAAQTFHFAAADQLADVRAQGAYSRAQSAPFVDGADPASAGRDLLGVRRRELSELTAWDSHVTDPLAQLADARQEESLRGEIASLQRSQTVDAWKMLPEMIAGSPGRGTLAGVLPTSALSAYFTPGAMAGTWGMPGGGGLSPAHPGGAAGAFDAAHGSVLAGSADNGATLREIAGYLRQIAHGGAAGGRSAPTSPATGSLNYAAGLGLGR